MRFLVIAAIIVSITSVVLAQEEGSSGAYGYTTVNYDQSSNTITAYSETDLDTYYGGYYRPELNLAVSDNSGFIENSIEQGTTCTTETDGSSYKNATCKLSGKANDTYTGVGSHDVTIIEYSVYIPPHGTPVYTYDDVCDFSYLGSLDPDEPFGDNYVGDFVYVTQKTNYLHLGLTYDSASTGPPPVRRREG
jgi:hypothetical protein